MKTTGSRASAVSQTRGFGDLLYDKAGSRPSLDLDFAGTSSLRDKITGEYLVDHTRQSNGTYIDSEGLVKNAVTNYVLYSQDLGNSYWTIAGGTVTTNFAEAPDGTQTATKVTINTGSSTYFGKPNNLDTLTPGKTYTWSIWVKSTGTSSHFTMQANAQGASSSDIYRLAKTPTPTEWTRYSVTFVATSAVQQSVYFNNYPDNYSVEALIWGAQVNEGSEPLDYVKTTNTINSAPRFTHERVETGNRISQSEIMGPGSGWSASNLDLRQPYAIKSPSGEFDGALIKSNTDNSFHNISKQNLTVKSGKDYTISAHFKVAAGTNNGCIRFYDGASYVARAVFTLTGDGTISVANGSNGEITKLEDGWYRCSITGTSTQDGSGAFISLDINSIYTHAGLGHSLYVWGAQFEEASGATTYAPSIDTFTSRASSATYVDSAGLVKTAALNYILNSDAPSHHGHTTTGSWLTTISYPSSAPTTDGPFGTNQKVKKVVISSDKPDFTQYGSLPLGTLTSDQKIRFGADTGGGGLGGGIANQTFTWSFYYRSLSGDRRFSVATGQNANRDYAQLTATSEWQRAEVSGARTDTLNILDLFYLFNGAADLEFTSFQVEKGSKASDYVFTEQTNNNSPSGVNTSAEARYSHDPETLTPTGLYLEPAATNTARVNNNFNQWTIGNGTITADNTTAPDGTQTADKFVPNTNNVNSHWVYQTNAVSGTLSLSLFVKAAGLNYVTLSSYVTGGNTTTRSVSFNLSNETIHTSQNATGVITKFPNDWYRVAITTTNSESQDFITIQPHNGNSPDLNNFFHVQYAGNGTDGMFLWGAQCEVGSFASSFIYNSTTSTLTRAADVYTSTANLTETFEPRGLLIEESRTNVVQYSEDFTDRGSSSGWADHNNRVTITANATTAPDGTQTADKIIPTTANESGHLCHHLTNSDGIASVYAKAAGYNYVSVILQKGAANGVGVSVNLTNGTIHASHNIHADTKVENVGNGWYRIVLKSTTTGHNHFSIQPHNGGTPDTSNHFRTTFAGDGTSGVFLWGAQQEVGTFATSYIPTSGSHVTRSADITSISGDNFGTYRTNQLLNTTAAASSNTQDYISQNCDLISYYAYSPVTNKFDAVKCIPDPSTSVQRIQFNTINLTNPHTISVYAKADGMNFIHIRAQTHGLCFNLSNGTTSTGYRDGATAMSAPTTSAMESIGDGWYRCSLTAPVANTGTLYVSASNSATTTNVQGADAFDGVLLSGFQAENSSTLTNYIPSTDTFTSRLGNATYVDSNGLIKTAYRNHLPYSNVLNPDWVAQTGSLTFNNAISPDGTQNAAKFIPQTSTSGQGNLLYISKVLNGALSIHAKAAGFNYVSLIRQGGGAADAAGVSVNLTNGSIHHLTSDRAEAEVIDVGNGWYRIILKITDTKQQNYFVVNPHNGGTVTTNHYRTDVTGDGSSGVLLWGAMQTDDKLNAGDYYPNLTGTLSGAPRYSHDPETLVPTGLYLEPEATNYFGQYPNTGSNATLTLNADTAPDGSNTAIKVTQDSSSNTTHSIYRSFYNTTGRNWTLSAFVKPIDWYKVYFTFNSNVGAADSYAVFDLSNGTIQSEGNTNVNASIKPYQNGWYRITIHNTGTTNGWRNQQLLFHKDGAASNGLQFDGDGTSSFLAWGFQIEEGTGEPTSYIYDTGTTLNGITKPADTYTSTATTVLDRDGGNKEAFWNRTGISAFAQTKLKTVRSIKLYGRLWQLSYSNTYTQNVQFDNNNLSFKHNVAAGNYNFGGAYNLSDGDTVKTGYAFQLNDGKGILNGSSLGSVTSLPLHSLTDSKLPTFMDIGRNGYHNNSYTNNPISRITFWKTRLPDVALINITKL